MCCYCLMARCRLFNTNTQTYIHTGTAHTARCPLAMVVGAPKAKLLFHKRRSVIETRTATPRARRKRRDLPRRGSFQRGACQFQNDCINLRVSGHHNKRTFGSSICSNSNSNWWVFVFFLGFWFVMSPHS